jgi:anti-sigma regulatory factor (Ser/Thr protein kinase)
MMPSVRTAELALPPEARSAGIARRFLSATLASWDADGYSDTGSLLLSELVTNAALHAGTEILVRVCLTSTGLRLEVADRSDRRPVIRHYSAQATTGRGLGMVDSLAERWGVVPEATGKTVWAELVDDHVRARSDVEILVDLATFPDLEDEPGDATPQRGPSIRRGWDAIRTQDKTSWAAQPKDDLVRTANPTTAAQVVLSRVLWCAA